MLRYILAIPMADKIERFMTFKGNELWKVVAKICLKSGLWMDGWVDGWKAAWKAFQRSAGSNK